jgi:AcrR family transcriptional regulator
MTDPTTRERIVAAADDLFYRQGFESTSFSDIAGVVRISRGNFYYHFKTKDEILDAVIDARLAERRAILAKWEVDGETPVERIRRFIDILLINGAKIKRYGCPIGTLSAELAKLNHGAQGEANQLFNLFRVWLRRQFKQMGRASDADELALHLLARSQGVATLANAFGDDDFIKREVNDMYVWVDLCADVVPTSH